MPKINQDFLIKIVQN